MFRTLRRRVGVLCVALAALELLAAPSADAVQASGSLVLLASKNSGVADGEQISVDVYFVNTSVQTPPQALIPAIANLTGPITIERRADGDCCGGTVSDALRFVPGSASGCDAKGAGVAGCFNESGGAILINLDPAGVNVPNSTPVFLATIRLENSVGPGRTLPRINLDAATGVCAVKACVTPPNQQCAFCAAVGGTFVKGDGDEITFCELQVCGDGDAHGREECDDGNLVDGDGCDSNCKLTACGNGVVTSEEECDDGNLDDDDGCDSNCTPTGCGNGIVTSGEACDDANAEPHDECDACGIGICPVGQPFVGGRFRLAQRQDGEDLTFAGRINCPEDGCRIVDPLRYGLELRVDTPPRGPLLDLTGRTFVLPPAEGLGCDPHDGWRVSSEGRSLVYRNRSGALRSAGCAPGSAGGLRKLQITLQQSVVAASMAKASSVVAGELVTDEIAIRLVAERPTFAAREGPLRFALVFTQDPVDALIRLPLCAATSFDVDDCRLGGGGEFTCG